MASVSQKKRETFDGPNRRDGSVQKQGEYQSPRAWSSAPAISPALKPAIHSPQVAKLGFPTQPGWEFVLRAYLYY